MVRDWLDNVVVTTTSCTASSICGQQSSSQSKNYGNNRRNLIRSLRRHRYEIMDIADTIYKFTSRNTLFMSSIRKQYYFLGRTTKKLKYCKLESKMGSILFLSILFQFSFKYINVVAYRSSQCHKYESTIKQRSYHYPPRSATIFESRTSSPFHSTILLSSNNKYGPGAEIWPPTNEIKIKLEDSFPSGVVPATTVLDLQQNKGGNNQSKQLIDSGKSRFRVFINSMFMLDMIRLSGASENPVKSVRPKRIKILKTIVNCVPFVCATSVLATGYCRPLDILLVILLSGYTWLLGVLSQSTTMSKDGSITRPTLPSLPPHGHIPAIISNPLGYKWSSSVNYDRWLILGVSVNIIGPIGLMIYGILLRIQTNSGTVLNLATGSARTLFFLACQAITEAACRRYVLPLPIRIWVPVAYNTVRLGYLWQWATSFGPSISHTVPRICQGLAIASLLYTFLNLFAFLLPIAVVKYMRAHFFAVEASHVSLRPGMEETVGLA